MAPWSFDPHIPASTALGQRGTTICHRARKSYLQVAGVRQCVVSIQRSRNIADRSVVTTAVALEPLGFICAIIASEVSGQIRNEALIGTHPTRVSVWN